jgi:hypothetical protein
MTQAERDRLVTLRKAQKKLIQKKQAAEELGITDRHVRRLIKKLKKEGDKAVIHGLRGKPSKRRRSEATRKKIIAILQQPQYAGFGPTLASEHLERSHGIRIGREALRQLMSEAGLWRAKKRKPERVHVWRERRARFGELVQWDTSNHDWLQGRGERLYLIHMIDDATSRLAGAVCAARYDRGESADAAGLDRAARADAGLLYRQSELVSHHAEDRPRPEATGAGRARAAAAHADWAGVEGIGNRIDAGAFGASQGTRGAELPDRAGPAGEGAASGRRRTLEQANQILDEVFLPWWEKHCTARPAQADDAHRALQPEHNLDAIFSQVEQRQVQKDYTFRFLGKQYRIEPSETCTGLRGGMLRIEQRLDGTMAVASQGRYLRYGMCPTAERAAADRPSKAAPHPPGPAQPRRRTRWMEGFDLHKRRRCGRRPRALAAKLRPRA